MWHAQVDRQTQTASHFRAHTHTHHSSHLGYTLACWCLLNLSFSQSTANFLPPRISYPDWQQSWKPGEQQEVNYQVSAVVLPTGSGWFSESVPPINNQEVIRNSIPNSLLFFSLLESLRDNIYGFKRGWEIPQNMEDFLGEIIASSGRCSSHVWWPERVENMCWTADYNGKFYDENGALQFFFLSYGP